LAIEKWTAEAGHALGTCVMPRRHLCSSRTPCVVLMPATAQGQPLRSTYALYDPTIEDALMEEDHKMEDRHFARGGILPDLGTVAIGSSFSHSLIFSSRVGSQRASEVAFAPWGWGYTGAARFLEVRKEWGKGEVEREGKGGRATALAPLDAIVRMQTNFGRGEGEGKERRISISRASSLGSDAGTQGHAVVPCMTPSGSAGHHFSFCFPSLASSNVPSGHTRAVSPSGDHQGIRRNPLLSRTPSAQRRRRHHESLLARLRAVCALVGRFCE